MNLDPAFIPMIVLLAGLGVAGLYAGLRALF